MTETHSTPSILVVDDTPEILHLVSAVLKDTYRVKVASHGEAALKLARSNPSPDLILLDVMMPGMDGHQVCAALKADASTQHIPVIFLTALTSAQDEEKGFDAGAVDYVTKPITPRTLLARIKTHLELKAAHDYMRSRNALLQAEVSEKTREVSAVQDATILAMASMAETRDSDTGNHIRRTQHYVKALAEQLRTHPRFATALTPAYIQLLFASAPLHDIGKVGIPDRILLKPGPLEPHEFEIMKTHTTLGRDAIAYAEQSLGTSVNFLTMAKEIAYGHQEKWDGSGYPQGLAGDDIPLSARFMALADVYDALISRRIYKDAVTHERAVQVIQSGSGSHFDPDVVQAFTDIQQQFDDIAQLFADSDEDLNRKMQYLIHAVAEDVVIDDRLVL